jgi:hypothetical protein
MSNFKNRSTRFSAEESTKLKILTENAFPACKRYQAEYANFVRESVSKCKLCQVENERFGRNSLSKGENLSNRTDLKNQF